MGNDGNKNINEDYDSIGCVVKSLRDKAHLIYMTWKVQSIIRQIWMLSGN